MPTFVRTLDESGPLANSTAFSTTIDCRSKFSIRASSSTPCRSTRRPPIRRPPMRPRRRKRQRPRPRRGLHRRPSPRLRNRRRRSHRRPCPRHRNHRRHRPRLRLRRHPSRRRAGHRRPCPRRQGHRRPNPYRQSHRRPSRRPVGHRRPSQSRVGHRRPSHRRVGRPGGQHLVLRRNQFRRRNRPPVSNSIGKADIPGRVLITTFSIAWVGLFVMQFNEQYSSHHMVCTDPLVTHQNAAVAVTVISVMKS